jgi:hypothetical protein
MTLSMSESGEKNAHPRKSWDDRKTMRIVVNEAVKKI